jgi:hypothetical protein
VAVAAWTHLDETGQVVAIDGVRPPLPGTGSAER